jgi:hypothetical protein
MGSGQPSPAKTTLADILREMRRTTDRDRVGDLAVNALRDHFSGGFDVGMVLIIRAPIAIGWKGFVRATDEPVVEQLAMPLDLPSLIQRPYRDRRPLFGPPTGVTSLDRRLWLALGGDVPAEVLAAPVLLRGEVVCIIYGHARAGTSAAFLADAGSLAATMAAAFERLLRSTER